MDGEKIQDKCRGPLIGGAVGDALGYEVEFMSLSSILKRFGDKGITRYVLHNGVAEFSDDTQMTLFTAEGLLNGIIATKADKPEAILPYIKEAYITWYKTQTEKPSVTDRSWLSYVQTLWSRRAPGNTCLGALGNITTGKEVRNNSKGCGGVMRVAPIGIFAGAHPLSYNVKFTALLAAYSADLTHKHIASTFASALMAMIVANCIELDYFNQHEFECVVGMSMASIARGWPGDEKEWSYFTNLMRRAMELGKSDVPERNAIRELGEGWVGDDALAIAVFSVMRHIDNFEDCIVCAVNHDGDSDSTGAIAGNIIGAILGYSAIPKHYIENLEIESILVSVADDLCADVGIREVNLRVSDRYMKHLPVDVAKD